MTPVIVFVHKGHNVYIEWALRQARRSNPAARIVLIGDVENRCFSGLVEHLDLSQFDNGAAEFRKRYVHLSTNNLIMEQFCFERWFVIRDFCRQSGIDSIFCCDTDLMIFSDLREIPTFGAEFDFCLSECTSGHAALWKRIAVLEEFCSFVMEVYSFETPHLTQEVMNFYRVFPEQGRTGGVCDMTLLAMFARRRSVTVLDTTTIIEGGTLDDNINFGTNGKHVYRTEHGLKKMVWVDGLPHAQLELSGELVRFHVLHCQGPGKRHMKTLYEGTSPKGREAISAWVQTGTRIGHLGTRWLRRCGREFVRLRNAFRRPVK